MIVLGVDPGTQITGWTVLDNARYIDGGIIDFTKLLDMSPLGKLQHFNERISEIEEKYRPDEVHVEKMFIQGSNAHTALLVVFQKELEFCVRGNTFAIPATTVKMQVAGHGRATKEDIAEIVRIITECPSGLNENINDAISIALAEPERKKK